MIVKQRSKIVIGGSTVYVKDDLLTDTCYYDGKFIGTAIAKMLEFTAKADRSYRGSEVIYYRDAYNFGLNTWESELVGTFIVTDVAPNDNEREVRVTAYDYMLKTAIDYAPSVAFPAALSAVYADLLSQCGLSAAGGLDVNADIVVADNQFAGETCQFVLGKLAEITGNFAHINSSDAVELIFHSSSVSAILPSHYSKLINKRDNTPITVLTLNESYSEGEEVSAEWAEGVSTYGRNSYTISDNGFANTEEKKSALAPALLNKLKGFSYSGFELNDCFAHQNLKCGDMVDITDNDGITTRSLVLSRELGAQKSVLRAGSYVIASIAYNNAVRDPAKKALIEVDKANARITSLVEETLPALAEALSVNLSASAYAVGVNSESVPVLSGSFTASVEVLRGGSALSDYTLSTTSSHAGLTCALDASDGTITISWGAETAIAASSTYLIAVTVGPSVVTKQVSIIAIPAGSEGDTPFVGENGTWHIGDTDTGIKADVSDELEDLRLSLASQKTEILQTTESIVSSAIKEYAGTDTYGNAKTLTESMEQAISSNSTVLSYKNQVDDLSSSTDAAFAALSAYLRYGTLSGATDNVGLEMGKSDSEIKVRIVNDKLIFYTGNYESADADNVIFALNAASSDVKIGKRLNFNDKWERGIDADGNFYHVWIGG